MYFIMKKGSKLEIKCLRKCCIRIICWTDIKQKNRCYWTNGQNGGIDKCSTWVLYKENIKNDDSQQHLMIAFMSSELIYQNKGVRA